MTAQVVPYMSQADLFNLNTYIELGFWGAAFAIGMLLFVFCVVKGHIKIIACGPNEGGIREFFGVTLWMAGSGPHLHISGIFAFRKVSFATREVEAEGEANRCKTVFVYSIGIKIRVRKAKDSIRLRVYAAEDLNRGDAENDEAIKQVTSQLTDMTREALEADTAQSEIERVIKDAWGQIELAELHDIPAPYGRSTYGYEIICTWTKKLVERPESEMSRAISGSDLDLHVRAVTSVAAISGRTA